MLFIMSNASFILHNSIKVAAAAAPPRSDAAAAAALLLHTLHIPPSRGKVATNTTEVINARVI